MLIDDKPFASTDPFGNHALAPWTHVVYSSTTDENSTWKHPYRMFNWKTWKETVWPLLTLESTSGYSEGTVSFGDDIKHMKEVYDLCDLSMDKLDL